jgi:hypothetical protein
LFALVIGAIALLIWTNTSTAVSPLSTFMEVRISLAYDGEIHQ